MAKPTQKARFLCAAALLLCCSASQAQQYNFKFYAQEQGLNNLDVNALAQDRPGFIWVATQNGLYRYEGVRFRSFGAREGVPGSDIEGLHVAPDGTLWANGDWGAAWFDGRRFNYLDVQEQLNLPGANRIASDWKFTYLASTQGLLRVQRVGDHYEATLLSRETASSVAIGKTGVVWYVCGTDVCTLNGDSSEHIGSRSRITPTVVGIDRRNRRWDRLGAQLISPFQAPGRRKTLSAVRSRAASWRRGARFSVRRCAVGNPGSKQ
jgi:Two component regulator propeller